MIVVGISGPPRAGKDTAREIMRDLLPLGTTYYTARMSQPLKDAAAPLLPHPRWAWEEFKDLKVPELGISYRQLQINIWRMLAESSGEAVLGRLWLARISKIKPPHQVVFIPDFGRAVEVLPILEAGFEVFHYHITRMGTSYAGDSRENVQIEGLSRRAILNPRPWEPGQLPDSEMLELYHFQVQQAFSQVLKRLADKRA